MRTTAQQQASRTNGALSRGPVTPEGKVRVSQNGTTHGIHSKRVVLVGEDPQAFNDLHQSLILTWQPVNDFEANLITDIAEARWRLARFLSLETASLDFQVELMRANLDQNWPSIEPGTRHALAFNELITRNRTFEVLVTAIRTQHRIIDRATSQLIRLRKLRPDLLAPPDTTTQPGQQPQHHQPVAPHHSAAPGATEAAPDTAIAPEEKQQTKPGPAVAAGSEPVQSESEREIRKSKPTGAPQPRPGNPWNDPFMDAPISNTPPRDVEKRFPEAA